MYTIFLVEDDATIARAITAHLESWGFAVKEIGRAHV